MEWFGVPVTRVARAAVREMEKGWYTGDQLGSGLDLSDVRHPLES